MATMANGGVSPDHSEAILDVYFPFQEDDEEVEDFEFQQLYDFQNGCRVTALAWSPETSTVTLPKLIRSVQDLQLLQAHHYFEFQQL